MSRLDDNRDKKEKIMSKYSVVGKRVPKVDARVKVTGRALYADDIHMPRFHLEEPTNEL